jgi:hypothetical protein
LIDFLDVHGDVNLLFTTGIKAADWQCTRVDSSAFLPELGHISVLHGIRGSTPPGQ